MGGGAGGLGQESRRRAPGEGFFLTRGGRSRGPHGPSVLRGRTLRATSLMGRWKLALSTSSVMLLDWPHPRFCDGKMRVGQRRGWGSTEVGRVVGRAARATTSATGVRGPRWRSPDGDGKKRPCDSSCRRRCAPFVATTRQRIRIRGRLENTFDHDLVIAAMGEGAPARGRARTLGIFSL